jgi:hypothetical protein
MSDDPHPDSGPDAVPMSPELADAWAAELLGDLRTRLGGPHVSHARRVAQLVGDTDDQHVVPVALLHDVVEKGAISMPDLLARTGDKRLVALVDLLTKRDDESEEEYLGRVVTDPVALSVKRADLLDKQFHDDASVDGETALMLWQEAKQKLLLLERLARAHEEAQRAPAEGAAPTASA